MFPLAAMNDGRLSFSEGDAGRRRDRLHLDRLSPLPPPEPTSTVRSFYAYILTTYSEGGDGRASGASDANEGSTQSSAIGNALHSSSRLTFGRSAPSLYTQAGPREL